MLLKPYQNLNNIQISGPALHHNFVTFQNLNPHTPLAPVLKANAYGHGLVLIAKWIDTHLKVPYLCVDSLFEAYELSKARIRTPILIIGYTSPDNFRTFKRLPFTFPAFDEATLSALNRYQPGAKVHLKLDTGMNRYGFLPHQIGHFIMLMKKYPRLVYEGLYSHLSQADDPAKKAFTHQQIKLFTQSIKQFTQSGITFTWRHLAATSGGVATQNPSANLIRLGLGFYGYSPFPPETKQIKRWSASLRPALRLTSRITQIKEVQKGSQISYGGTFIAPHPLTLAILPIGYADGVNRRLSNRGQVTVGEWLCPIVGKVCMNITIIDITKVPTATVGEKVTIFNPHPGSPNSIGETSKLCDMIPYELLTGLNPTIKRVISPEPFV